MGKSRYENQVVLQRKLSRELNLRMGIPVGSSGESEFILWIGRASFHFPVALE